jgi:hypothetical protein
MLCSCFFSYSKQSSVAIRPIGPQVVANCLDQRSASPRFKQPSSTSTVSLSTASLIDLFGQRLSRRSPRHRRRVNATVARIAVACHRACLGADLQRSQSRLVADPRRCNLVDTDPVANVHPVGLQRTSTGIEFSSHQKCIVNPMETPTIKIPQYGAPQPDVLVLSPPPRTVLLLVIDAQSILAQGFRRTPPRFQKHSRPIRSKGDRPQVGHGQIH